MLPLKGSGEVNSDIDGMTDGADTQSNSGAIVAVSSAYLVSSRCAVFGFGQEQILSETAQSCVCCHQFSWPH